MAHPANPTTPAFSDPLEWRTAYLEIHTLPEPSRRYTYYLWIIILVVFVSVAVQNVMGCRRGYVGTRYYKWAVRRRTWRGWRYGVFIGRRHPVSFPSNGRILGAAVLLVGTLLLSFAGPDYIPSNNADDLSQSVITRMVHDLDYYKQLRPQYVIQKAWWTIGGRTGLIAFSLFPLCVLFALKTPPFAVFAIPGLAQLHFDKLAWFHRWSGRLIWLMTTIHVAAWLVQLYQDTSDENGTRVILSAWSYERFRYGWVGYLGLTMTILLSLSPIRRLFYELFYLLHIILVPVTIIGAALHHPPVWLWCWVALSLWAGERVWRAIWFVYINIGFGSVSKPPCHSKSDSAAGAKLAERSDAWEMTLFMPKYDPPEYPAPLHNIPYHYRPSSALTYEPPQGYAHCELVSGMTVRVTLITPGFFTWAPGQHFLLNMPSVSKVTSHPFTCASICDDESTSDSARALVFLIRAKSGWTKNLWDKIVTLSVHYEIHPFAEKPPEGTKLPTHGVLLRAFVDGPFGSSSRARWGEHSTVVLIAGGTGASFTLAILEYVCACIAGRDGRRLGGREAKRHFRTSRVRFIWLVREFSHVQWGASILRRCLSMIPPQALQVEIFVTNTQTIPPIINSPRPPVTSYETKNLHTEAGSDDSDHDLLVPPTPSFARGRNLQPSSNSRSSSVSSIGSSTSTDDFDSSTFIQNYPEEEEYDMSDLGIREHFVLDLTNFDGDNDAVMPGEEDLTRKVIKAGKLQRARTRKLKRKQESHDLGVWSPEFGTPSSSSTKTPVPEPSNLRIPIPGLGYAPYVKTKRSSRTLPDVSPMVPSRPTSYISELVDENYGPFNPRDSGFDIASIRSLLTQPGKGSRGEEISLEVTDREMRDVIVVSEHARPGKPNLERILVDEVHRATGSIIVGCCGPSSLTMLVSKLVAAQINPDMVRGGDMRGSISLVSEEFSY